MNNQLSMLKLTQITNPNKNTNNPRLKKIMITNHKIKCIKKTLTLYKNYQCKKTTNNQL